MSGEWLPEVEVPDEFGEMGRRNLDGMMSVGGKQGVYVDIEGLKGASPVLRTTYEHVGLFNL